MGSVSLLVVDDWITRSFILAPVTIPSRGGMAFMVPIPMSSTLWKLLDSRSCVTHSGCGRSGVGGLEWTSGDQVLGKDLKLWLPSEGRIHKGLGLSGHGRWCSCRDAWEPREMCPFTSMFLTCTALGPKTRRLDTTTVSLRSSKIQLVNEAATLSS